MKKRCVILLLMVLCLVSAVGVQGYAAQPRASEQIISYDATLSRNGSGRLNISFMIQCTAKMDALGTISIVVQRFNGTSWVSEYTFNIREYSGMQTQHQDHYSGIVAYSPGYSGAQYRAMVFFYARNSTGSDTAVKTTNIVTS